MSPEISFPKAIPEIDGLTLDWEQERLKCEVRAIYQHHDGNVACELHFTTSAPGFNPHLLRHHISDLSNATGRDRLAALLTRSYNHVPWDDVMEYVCEFTLSHLRKPPEANSIIDFSVAKPPEFALWPFLLRRENNMIYGPGGGGKSILALLWLALMEGAIIHNQFGWILHDKPLSIVYLDWERSLSTHSFRMAGILTGLGYPTIGPQIPLNYHRCRAPLPQYIREIQSLINQHKAEGIIVDSAGVASGGDMNSTEPALKFFNGLSRLTSFDGQPLTSLIVSHEAKNIETNRKSPYGNVYWRNECSSVWQILPAEDSEHNLSRLTLRCDKHNDYSWQTDIGLEVSFNANPDVGTAFKLCQPPLPKGESHEDWQIIYDTLAATTSIKTLEEMTGLKYANISKSLRTMEKQGFTRQIGYGAWGQGKPLPEKG